MVDVVANQPIVIDNGSGMLKAGFAGGEKPKIIYTSAVGRAKHTRVMVGGALESNSSVYVGKKLEEHRGAMIIKYPMKHGIVDDWNDMERIWRHVYERENLNIPFDEHSVLLTEAPLNPHFNRHKSTEIFFESLGVPALYMVPQAILALYASGRTTGVVLDCGDGVTHCMPVYEGFSIANSINRSDVAGRDVTEQLQLLLRRAGVSLHSSSEKEIVRQIKEEKCYVAFDPIKEEALKTHEVPYKLPDGQVVSLGDERFKATEILFDPGIIGLECMGVADSLRSSIAKADTDLRKYLFEAIVLSGGSTCFPGFGDRLLDETRKKIPRGTKIKIFAPPERILSTWIGGSILASLSTFRSMWVTKAEYQEQGKSAMDRKGL